MRGHRFQAYTLPILVTPQGDIIINRPLIDLMPINVNQIWEKYLKDLIGVDQSIPEPWLALGFDAGYSDISTDWMCKNRYAWIGIGTTTSNKSVRLHFVIDFFGEEGQFVFALIQQANEATSINFNSWANTMSPHLLLHCRSNMLSSLTRLAPYAN